MELKRNGKAQEARALIENEGLALWTTAATKVREVMLSFQQVVSTRNDLGSLASMHNKLVRLTLFRLPASIKEILDELPVSAQRLQADLLLPLPHEPGRVFLPTRPSILLHGESVPLSAVAPGTELVTGSFLFTRVDHSPSWVRSQMQLRGRRTYVSQLGPFERATRWVDYYVQAELQGLSRISKVTAPREAPEIYYTVTTVS